MRNRLILGVISFALSLCALADPEYFVVATPSGNFYSYAYPPNYDLDPVALGFPAGTTYDPVSGTFSDPNEQPLGYASWEDPFGDDWGIPFSPDSYLPSNPSYTDPVAPSDDPLSAPSGGGGGGEGGGSDPSDWLSAMLSLVRGVAVAVASLLTAAALLYIIFLWWRSFRRSMRSAER